MDRIKRKIEQIRESFKTFAREIVALLSKSLDNFKVAVIKGKEAISDLSYFIIRLLLLSLLEEMLAIIILQKSLAKKRWLAVISSYLAGLNGQPVSLSKFIQLLCVLSAVDPNPLAIVFDLFFNLVYVFPSPLFANAGITTSAPTINIVAVKTANIPRVVVVVWFIYFSQKHYNVIHICELS